MSKFNELNTAFNTDDDLIQPEVVEKKIEKVKAVSYTHLTLPTSG